MAGVRVILRGKANVAIQKSSLDGAAGFGQVDPEESSPNNPSKITSIPRGNDSYGWSHILQRHVRYYPSNVGKGTLFPTTNQQNIKEAILNVVNNPTSYKYTSRGKVVYENIFQFTNNTWAKIAVVTDGSNTIITSYPLKI